MPDLNNLQADRVVDARSVACPGPLLKLKKALDEVTVGQILEVRSCDKGSREDIRAWCTKTGQQFLGIVEHQPDGAAGYTSLFVSRVK